MPTARARKTEISETMWYRKSITGWKPFRRGLAGRSGRAAALATAAEEPADPEEGVVETRPDERVEGLPGGGRRERHREREQTGQHQHRELEVRDALPVEPRDALRVHQLAADTQPGEERAGHARASLVEELHERDVRADGDDELGSLVVRQQHRDVLAGAGGGEHDVLHAQGLDPLDAGRPAVPVGMDDDLRSAGQRA